MSNVKAWWVGVALLVTFVFAGELTTFFREYVYSRLGLSRNMLLSALWLLPLIAGFLVAYFSKKSFVLNSLSLILVLSVLGPLVHFAFGLFGATIDFGGWLGLSVTVQIYLALSVPTIGLGAVAGALLKKKQSPRRAN